MVIFAVIQQVAADASGNAGAARRAHTRKTRTWTDSGRTH